MSGLTVRGHKLALEINRAIDDGDSRRVVELVDSWGLQRAERLAVCRELDRPDADDVVGLRFDQWDRAGVRTVAHVWSEH